MDSCVLQTKIGTEFMEFAHLKGEKNSMED